MRDTPELSVVITVDFEVDRPATWEGVRRTLRTLAAEPERERVELTLVGSKTDRSLVPEDLVQELPELRVLYIPETSAYDMKLHGTRNARAEHVALLDGDCVPRPGWLGACLHAFDRCEDATVVSGRTTYPDTGLASRIFSLLARSYLEQPNPGPTRHLTLNNSVVRKDAFLDHATNTEGAHVSSLQGQALIRAGHQLAFDPDVHVEHAHTWEAERSIRASLGYGIVRVRQLDPSVPYAWTVRVGPLSAPAILAGRLLHSWAQCLRAGTRYRVSWLQQPFALALATVCCAMEVPAHLRALRGEPPPPTPFR